MSFWKYLRDRVSLIVGWVFFVLLTAFVMWLTPGMTVDFDTLSYLFIIEGVFLFVYLVGHYLDKQRWWRKLNSLNQDVPLQNYLEGAHSNEERFVEEQVNQVIRMHQEVMRQTVSAQQEQKDFIDSWVHEIKVPLAATELLVQSIEFDIEDQKYILLENELAKIDEYVDQVLYYARLDSFSRDYLIQEYDLKEIIQPVLRSQANYFIQKQLHYEVVGDSQPVLTDAKWVGFIFKQLLSNAIKYTPDNGNIEISIKRTTQEVQLVLQDSGIGIPKEDINRIFDKGFTGSNGRFAQQHSTGLGLYLAKNLAEKLGVHLSVTSIQGQGTKMIMHFPSLSFYNEKR
ncbi:MAG: two-component system sensor histidine kinase SapS [Enterococcus sp.]